MPDFVRSDRRTRTTRPDAGSVWTGHGSRVVVLAEAEDLYDGMVAVTFDNVAGRKRDRSGIAHVPVYEFGKRLVRV